MSRTLALFAIASIGWSWTLAEGTARADDATVESSPREFFEGKVRPILESHCFACHGPAKQKAGLRVDSRGAMMRGGDSGPILEPGDPKSSRLIEVLRYDGDIQMPPKRKLDDAEIAI